MFVFLCFGFPVLSFASGPNPSSEQLKELTLEQLGNVEVTSVSKEPEEVWKTPAAIYVITQEDIRRSGAKTLPDILRLAPGVEVSQIDGDKWAVGIRGFEGRLAKSVLVLIDGRSVYTPLFAGVYWEMQTTMIQDIERIEVIRGPGGTIWGSNAVNGVINIITKNSKDTHGGLVTVGGGNVTPGYIESRYGAGTDRFSYRIYGRGFDQAPEYHSDHHNFDRWRLGQAGFRTDWNPNANDSLTVEGDAYGTIAGQRLNISYYSPPELADTEADGYFSGQDIVAGWKHVFSARSDVRVHAYYDRTDRNDLNYREIRNTFDLDFIHHISFSRQNFIWGGGIRISPSHYFQKVPTVDFLPHHQTYNIFSGFVQDEITLVPDRLSFTVGSKFEHNSFSGFEFQPSGRILWTPTPHQSLWAAATRAVRTPSRIEEGFQFTALAVPSLPLYLRLIGDGDFSPEQLVGYELGYRRYFKPKVYLDIASFYNQYDDLLSVENLAPFVETSPAPTHLILPLYLRNGVDAETRGFEISPVWDPVKWIRFQASYSYMHLNARDKPTSDDASTVKQLEGDSPQHMATVQSTFQFPRNFELDLDYRYMSALPDQKIPAYSTADAQLQWHFGEHFGLALIGRNLLQPYHFEYGGDPGPLVGIKRSAFAQITWRQ